MIEVVFFDAGDTLLRPHPSFSELFSAICRERGRPVEAHDVRAVQERLAPHLIDIAEETGVETPSLSPEGSRRFWTFLYRRFLEELGMPDPALEDALYERFSDMSSYKLFDDVLPVLDSLAASGYRLGLISNFERWLEEMLVELEVGHRFERAVISGVVGIEKPDPEIYRVALRDMGVGAESALHVGDSLALDVVPAASIGMRVVLLDRAGRYPDAPCPKIAGLEELPKLVEKL